MSTATAARADERAARVAHRRTLRMQRAAADAREKAWRDRLAAVLTDTRKTHPACRCELRATMTRGDLRALGAGCTAGRWVCPRLDAVRRVLGL